MNATMLLDVTALYAGLLAVIYLWLSLRVSQTRRRLGVDIGDADNPEMLRAIRVHANFAENVPLLLLLLAIGEVNGGPDWLLHLFGIVLVAARVVHAWGLATRNMMLRVAGSGTTSLMLAVLGVHAIAQGLRGF